MNIPSRPIDEIRFEKIKKINTLLSKGINPFPAFVVFESIDINIAKNLDDGKTTSVKGKVEKTREHGKLIFMDVTDFKGKIQLAFKFEELGQESFEVASLIDAGDFVEVTGELFTTKSGEKTILVNQYNILSKAIRPLPESSNFLDKEQRLRKRYLDLLLNPDSKKVFDTRHKITRGIREFLDNKNYTEVETPILQPLYGGANAKPFTTNFNALSSLAYLRIAPELYLKRLIVGGMGAVYELARNFRNEGIDQTHYPEFTMLEVYIPYCDYHGMMDTMEEMLRYLNKQVLNLKTVTVGEKEVNLDQDWTRIAMTDLIKEKLAIDVNKMSKEQILDFANKNKVKVEEGISRGELIFKVFDDLLTDNLINPTWIIDYPQEVSPLAKAHRTKEGFTERFELYIGGKEIMDGWSELNNAVEQRERFVAEVYRKLDETESAQPLDEDFLESMEYGMPPFAGVGAGIDRLTMFFTNTWAIQETILFPFKKSERNGEVFLEKTIKETIIEPDKKSTSILTNMDSTELLHQYIKNEALINHCKMVAKAMKAYAKKLGQDENLWYETGLLHDLDWEMFPNEHPKKAVTEILVNYSDELKNAILAHAPAITGKNPETLIEKYLFACDEISGLMNAISLMRPNGFADMQVSSVKKKLKDKSFAVNVSRDDITQGVELIGGTLDEHIQFLINVFSSNSPDGEV